MGQTSVLAGWPPQMYASPTYIEGYGLTLSQIVYLSIVGPLMLAAFFEWVLWLAAFLYCLVKVYQKADHWSVRVLALAMMVLFTLLR
jgi:hypothetical protein